MNYRYLRILGLIFLVTFLASYARAQEYVTGLKQNTFLVKKSKEVKESKNDENYPAIILPFIEDFSDYLGYPDPALWMDKKGFVNNTFALYPPTIGVVTLDALDENGRLYSHASTSAFPADTLTSRPIRLDSVFSPNRKLRISDSLYFSFYYQPGGGTYSYPYLEWERVGNQPDSDDRLVLEFGFATGDTIFTGYEYTDYTLGQNESYRAGDSIENPFMPGLYYIFESAAYPGQVISMPSDSLFGPQMEWDEVWSTGGISLDEWLNDDPKRLTYFKQVLIPILDERYLRDNFQFRFHNYASLENNGLASWAGNVDQWHIDYIRLDMNRTFDDTHPNDVAFVLPTTSFLKEYYAMPWKQYRNTDRKDAFTNYLSNLSTAEKNTNYTYSVVKNGTIHVDQYTTNNSNAKPYHTDGLVTYGLHAQPAINFTISNNDGQDSAIFTIQHIFQVVGGTGDFRHQNDTMVFEQKFYNYYAYDDGTAEAGYTLISTLGRPEASLAVRFSLAEADTLRAVRIWFNSLLEGSQYHSFELKIWDDNNNLPGQEIYTQRVEMPGREGDYLDFFEYRLDQPLYVSGTFYVGFHQENDVQLNIGFDQNNDARTHFVYMTARDWQEPFLKGAPMIRPVLGKPLKDNVSVPDYELPLEVKAYPNPTRDRVHFTYQGNEKEVSKAIVFDLYGKLLFSQEMDSWDDEVNLHILAPGVYFIRLFDLRNRPIHTAKIIKL